jgi:Ca2+-binding EF-hand superfamily protein
VTCKLAARLLPLLCLAAWAQAPACADEPATPPAGEAAAALPATATGPPAAAAAVPPAETGQPIDVALVTDGHVVVIRAYVKRAGKDFLPGWQEFVEKRFHSADADGDGTLNAEEMEKVKALITPLRSNRNRNGAVFAVEDGDGGNNGGAMISDPPAAGAADRQLNPGATCQQFVEFMRGGSNTPVRVEGRVQNSVGSAPLFARLDADSDGKLSASEVARAYEVLERLDYNDADVFGRAQFQSPEQNNNQNGQPRQQNPQKTRLAVKLLSQGGAGMAVGWAEKIRAHFAAIQKDKDQSNVTRSALLYDEETFSSFDADGDGVLDSDELAQLMRRPLPHVEMVATIDRQPAGLTATATHLERVGSRLDEIAGHSTLVIGHERIELALGQFQLGDSAQNMKQNITDRFEQADEDNNDYLDNNEIQRYGLGGLMALDADGDGKLYLREIIAYIDSEAEIAGHRLVVAIVDHGHGLFEGIDADHDEMLSRRELKNFVKRIDQWDQNGDGELSMEEVPHLYSLEVAQEQVRLPVNRNNGFFNQRFAGNRRTAARKAPSWFQQMDRNGDGDLSKQEFLGTPAQFRKFDTDGDLLIDADEAMAIVLTAAPPPPAATASAATTAAVSEPPTGDAADDIPAETP